MKTLGPVILAFGWLGFAAFQVIALALAIIGLPVIFLLSITHAWMIGESSYYPGRQVMVWRGHWLTWAWGNLEDGVDGLRGGDPAQFWWRDRAATWPAWKRAFVWSALRNSTNNLRFLVKWVGGPRWEPTFRGATYRFGWNPSGFPVFERL